MAMKHPPDLHERFRMDEEQFKATFEVQENGTCIAKKSFDFFHAVGTSYDRPETIATNTKTGKPKRGNDAGDLWEQCTGKKVTESKCAVQNCTNHKRKCSENPYKAGATAHVYLTSQKSDDPIEDMVLMPTCKATNTHGQSSKCSTQYPKEGQEANLLEARPGTQVIFIRIANETAELKGGKGRGRGQGGTFGGPYGKAETGSGKGGSGKGSTPY